MRFWLLVVTVLAAAVGGDLLIGVSPPGLVAFFGFIGAGFLTVVAKAYGNRVVYRPVDHRPDPEVLPEDRLSGAPRGTDDPDGSVEGEAERA